jgi:hypothetical protein
MILKQKSHSVLVPKTFKVSATHMVYLDSLGPIAQTLMRIILDDLLAGKLPVQQAKLQKILESRNGKVA